jgi:hypothetical protein
MKRTPVNSLREAFSRWASDCMGNIRVHKTGYAVDAALTLLYGQECYGDRIEDQRRARIEANNECIGILAPSVMSALKGLFFPIHCV